jgi:spore coat protein H
MTPRTVASLLLLALPACLGMDTPLVKQRPGPAAVPVVPAPPVQWEPFAPPAAPAQTLLVLELTSVPLPGGPTVDDLDVDIDPNRKPHPTVPVIMRAADYGQGVTAPNGTLQLRGHSNRRSDQKSYTIKLHDESPGWRGTRTIQLNKHPYDLTRLRNKLSFDLFAALPEMTSLRSAFVQLSIDGKDYGLFTQIEHVGDRYLREHGFHEDSPLYKAEQFEFLPLPALKAATDPAYSKAEFERILEIKGPKDHSRLLAMLADLNDLQQPINQVFERHFDRKGYLTWMAINVLLRNLDSSSQNFYLVCPLGTDRWRFIPWDFDGAWGFYDQPSQKALQLPRWRNGLANWWGTRLHRRFFSEPSNLAQFEQRLTELATTFFTHERITALIDSYRPIIAAAITRPPDSQQLPTAAGDRTEAGKQWQAEVDRLLSVVNGEQARFRDLLGRPMPFFLGVPASTGGRTKLNWDPAIDLQGDPVLYDVTVARTPDLQAPVYQATGLPAIELTLPDPLPPDRYYWRVTARETADPEGSWQLPFDEVTVGATRHLGVASFVVP